MARMSEGRSISANAQNQAIASAVSSGSACMRCGGLMVTDFCMDLLNCTGELEVAAKRCVQCGEIIDPVIERNRRVRQEAMTIRSLGRSAQWRECQMRS